MVSREDLHLASTCSVQTTQMTPRGGSLRVGPSVSIRVVQEQWYH